MFFFKATGRSLESDIRFNQGNLMCSGMAVIIFGAWSIINIFMYKFLDPKRFSEILDASGVDVTPELYKNIIFWFAVVVLFLDFLLRVYIGRSAINESRGKKKGGRLYLLLSVFIIIISVISDISTIIGCIFDPAPKMNGLYFMSSAINLTTMLAFWEIVICALRLRRLERLLEKNNSLPGKP